MILSAMESMRNTASATVASDRLAALDEATAWNSVIARDPTADENLFYGVTTTRIYCRPSCPSRRPKRENIAFFSSTEAAERAGFRACHRCRPNRPKSTNTAVQRARDYIDEHAGDLDERITLALLSDHAGLSQDRKSTRLNSSHVEISYAVFCLKKKKKTQSKNSATINLSTLMRISDNNATYILPITHLNYIKNTNNSVYYL